MQGNREDIRTSRAEHFETGSRFPKIADGPSNANLKDLYPRWTTSRTTEESRAIKSERCAHQLRAIRILPTFNLYHKTNSLGLTPYPIALRQPPTPIRS